MAEIKLTKNELRAQEKQLHQLEKYLPTLQLKKAMLQAEVHEARLEIEQIEKEYIVSRALVDEYSLLLSERISFEPLKVAKITAIHRRYENIAGVEVPYFEGVEFEKFEYSLIDTPPWLDSAIAGIRHLAEMRARVRVATEKKEALEHELRQVSIRVNLFEKILIPRAQKNIKKIKVFLGDQQLSAVGQIKVAKKKIEMHKILMRGKTHAH